MDLVSISPFNNPYLAAGDSFSGAEEPSTGNNHVLRPPKRPLGRPKGSKNKPKAVRDIPAGEPTDNNHILRQVKRPVGRPKGSKNKPKTVAQPIEAISLNSQIVIEIPAGDNVVQSLLQLCHCYNVSVTVLSASGQLAEIIPLNEPNFSIPGPYSILSLSCTVVPTPPPPSAIINSPEISFPFVVVLSMPDGAALGGIVARSAKAASMVNVVAMTTALNNVTFETNNTDVEITPLNDIRPESIQFNEFLQSLISGDLMKNQIHENEKEQEQDQMMKKTNNAWMIDEDIWRFEENLTPALRVEPYFTSS